MRSLVLPVILLAASAALARPAKQSPPAKPKAPKAACAPLDGGSPRWVIANGSVTMCLASPHANQPESCFAFSATAAPKPVAAPPDAPSPKADAEVREDAGKLAVCTATRCKPLGKELAAAIKTGRYNVSTLSATSDGKVVVLGGDAWVVARDTQLEPKKPGEYGREEANLNSVEVAGNAIIASWANCAGPCGRSILIDAKGRNRGEAFGTGVYLPLDAKRLAVLSLEAETELVVIDVKSARQTSRVPLVNDSATSGGVEKLDDGNVVVAWQREDDWKVQFIATPAGKPARAGASHTIAACSN